MGSPLWARCLPTYQKVRSAVDYGASSRVQAWGFGTHVSQQTCISSDRCRFEGSSKTFGFFGLLDTLL